MTKIFVDLEMNPMTRKERIVSGGFMKREIIEIGAVMLDEKDNEISLFNEYVRPLKNELICDDISRLTGISTKMVIGADTLQDVIERFIQWCGNDYEIYSWSDTDYYQISKEVRFKEIDCHGLDSLVDQANWIDYQIQYMNMFGYKRLMRLRDAIDIAGLDFQGKAHGALADARTTAYLYREAKGARLTGLMSEIKAGHEEFSVSLGSLFDFSQMAG